MPMCAATTDEIVAAYRLRYDVHVVGSVLFHGVSGHFYVVPREPTNPQLARLTPRCGNAEVSLTQLDSTYMIRVGDAGIARMALIVPQPGGSIDHFRWIAHTHPVDRRSRYYTVSRGATDEDREALARVFALWGQTQSRVVACAGGRVVNVDVFSV